MLEINYQIRQPRLGSFVWENNFTQPFCPKFHAHPSITMDGSMDSFEAETQLSMTNEAEEVNGASLDLASFDPDVMPFTDLAKRLNRWRPSTPGWTINMGMIVVDGEIMISEATNMHDKLLAAIHNIMREFNKVKGFKYHSITIVKNLKNLHIPPPSGQYGAPTVAFAVGEFTGGHLVVDSVPYDTRMKPTPFNGTLPHYVKGHHDTHTHTLKALAHVEML